jgi:hypothetical protein
VPRGVFLRRRGLTGAMSFADLIEPRPVERRGSSARWRDRVAVSVVQSYVLVVERGDGSEFKITLEARADTGDDPVIVVVPRERVGASNTRSLRRVRP